MIRKLFQMLALPDALTARMAARERVLLALTLASMGSWCMSYGLKPDAFMFRKCECEDESGKESMT